MSLLKMENLKLERLNYMEKYRSPYLERRRKEDGICIVY